MLPDGAREEIGTAWLHPGRPCRVWSRHIPNEGNCPHAAQSHVVVHIPAEPPQSGFAEVEEAEDQGEPPPLLHLTYNAPMDQHSIAGDH